MPQMTAVEDRTATVSVYLTEEAVTQLFSPRENFQRITKGVPRDAKLLTVEKASNGFWVFTFEHNDVSLIDNVITIEVESCLK